LGLSSTSCPVTIAVEQDFPPRPAACQLFVSVFISKKLFAVESGRVTMNSVNFWSIEPKHVELLQGGDGGQFRDFVNRIIRAEAYIHGIPDSAIATDSTNAADGGVDCKVSEAAPMDSGNRLRERTCWQYKAMDHSKITENILRKEVKKPFCAALLREGYAYRLCIADSLTPEKKTKWEALLKDEIQKINPSSPDPQVLTSQCLAEWATRFPAIITAQMDYYGFWHIENWGKGIVTLTREYVPVPIWESIPLAANDENLCPNKSIKINLNRMWPIGQRPRSRRSGERDSVRPS